MSHWCDVCRRTIELSFSVCVRIPQKCSMPEAPKLEASSRSCSRFMSNRRMFPLARNALSRLRAESIQQAAARQTHQRQAPDFHDKYGNAVLASGATFRVAVWVYTATQIGIEWNPSPVGTVTPKEWREQ